MQIFVPLLALFSSVQAQLLWVQFYETDRSGGGLYSHPASKGLGGLDGAAPATSFSVGASHVSSLHKQTPPSQLRYFDVEKTADYLSFNLWAKSISKARFGEAVITRSEANGTMISSFWLKGVEVVTYDVFATTGAATSREHVVLSYTAISYNTAGRTIGNYTEGGYRVNYDLETGTFTAVA